ncbi:HAD family phosphatase [Anabaena cylindrica FACHB-243]|uniref:HAD-superfamily hydrolase, subfamily IA, variant 3 n=1 Tax=Anabaena cylindrica (strain ATCC 27899 / PCC 7122) TaxID=272123 RepID=K9ZC87_ANACC|nr:MULTISPECIES: HAD family phosphatase [Anabaena]AFZ56197.1 HAD-superfamily hydrolase, subfamily IA, variant 3 [Anabaena cylindrica PCC 7122]MBD2417425.1 HAD family phosphatase [Anabaena cylindrica FACHB-243]MBY5284419.1 HAD family phosphatase [Anabaena sp. CCAP 1446/1C]MBY5306254.1 HAD family phosphatase [Anabaena sp. CCAP 1446/1C]MCM2407594.1 HAD family phosphatase [Anabaena sp. CCAP 1446/1C]
MSLKAVLFDFNGVIIKDEPIHLQLIDEILIQENIQPQRVNERQASLGRSDACGKQSYRDYFQDLLKNRGRVITEEYLSDLLNRKAQAYVLELEKLEKLPLYAGVDDLIFQARSHNIKLGLVSDSLLQEIQLVLERAKLTEYFQIIVTGDDIATSKPQPEGYLLAVEKLNQAYPDLNLQPQECLAIEDTPAGIQAAKRAQMQVVGVANTYPFHMLQRQANWTVDYLTDLELDRVQEVFLQKEVKTTLPEC